MSVYDYKGNEIAAGASSDDIKQAFLALIASGEINLGASIGAILSYTGLVDAWIDNATAAYSNLLELYTQKPNVSVPFFVSTDQHGFGMSLEQHRWVNNIDTDGLNLPNINLGDTVYDYYDDAILNTSYGRIKQVKNYISVVGNHDKIYHSGGDAINELILNKTFMTTYNYCKARTPENCYVAYDGAHGVKFVCIDNYILSANRQSFTRGWTTDITNWIIRELSINDGYDIVICIHFPMHPKHRLRTELEETATQSSAENYNSPHQMACWNLIIARKNKSSGTFIDLDGVEHTYDFSNCDNRFLCILSGHAHEERISTEYGVTDYTSDWWGNNRSCVFGLIDRSSDKLHIWEFSNQKVSDELILDI